MKDILKIHRILISIFMLTIIALLYVNQQVLIYQMGLNLKENNILCSKLVDRNRMLVYNVLNLKSPLSLETKLLAKEVELNMPHKWQVVKLQNTPDKLIEEAVPKKGLFANLFVVGRVAEASPSGK